MLAELVCFLF